MNLLKEIKKLNVQHILLLVGSITLVLYLTNYSSQLGSLFSGMNNQNLSSNNDNDENDENDENNNSGLSEVKAAGPSGMNSGPSSINSGALSNNSNQLASNPVDLLPKDNNNQWGSLNPAGAGELSNINLLNAGHLAGEIGPVNKNSNLQLRAEPPNPRGNTGPWNSSTIESDPMKRGLDICN